MKRALFVATAAIALGLLWTAGPAQDAAEAAADQAADSEENKFAARSRAYDLEFAMSAAGNYKRRDTYWEGVIGTEDVILIPLQFFSGNDYVVALGLGTKENVVAVTAFDCTGKVMPLVPDEQEGRLLLQIRPELSGTHFLRLRLRNGTQAPTFGVLTYLYR